MLSCFEMSNANAVVISGKILAKELFARNQPGPHAPTSVLIASFFPDTPDPNSIIPILQSMLSPVETRAYVKYFVY